MADIRALVDIHREALPEDFLPRLGSAFLVAIFYPALIQDRGTAVWVLEEAGAIRCFAAFSKDTAAITRTMLKRPVRLSFALIRAIARRPLILAELFSLMGAHKSSIVASDPEIYVVATAAAFRGTGKASLVVQHGLCALERAGSHKLCIVRTSSASAAAFYRKLGFVDDGVEYRGPRRLKILRKHFRSADHGGG